jgi:hypothetical protein
VIVITGMHRSGTSLVSMVLDSFGLGFGDHSEFYAADQWNQEGYFERRDVVDINSRLITGFNRTTSTISSAASQAGYLLWSSERSMKRRASVLQPEISRLSRALDGLAVKDPRFCLTLPAWSQAVDDCVVCLRPPAEVALSLKRRQHVPLPVGFRFWDRHAQGLLDHAPARSLYIDFTGLAGSDPSVELARIDRHFELGLGPAELSRRFEAKFQRRLKNFEGETLPTPDRTARLWSALQERHRSQ